MSWIKSWWRGTSSTKEADDRDVAETQEDLQRKLKGLRIQRVQMEKNMQKTQSEAKRLHSEGRLDEARQKMLQAQQLKSSIALKDGQITNLSQYVLSVQETSSTVETAKTMRDGNRILKRQLDSITAEDIDDITDEADGLIGEGRDLSLSLAMPMTAGLDPAYEDDIAAQFAAWDDEKLVGTDLPAHLKSASPPVQDLPDQEQEETSKTKNQDVLS